MRKLASIQIVHTLEQIEGADFIERGSVKGWHCVVKKGEFTVGSRCVFFEIDSLLPKDNPAFSFMEKSKYRVKTVKLRGQISQGLALPISILPERFQDKEVGFDLTTILEIVKWSPPESSDRNGLTKSSFPNYVPKTDETRLQSCRGVLRELKGIKMYSTVKVDGTSSTFAHLDGDIDVCSRKLSKKEDDKNAYWRMARRYDILDILKHEKDIAIQGEIAGFWHKGRKSPIQKNRLDLNETDLFVFDVFEIREGKYLGFHELMSFCERYKLNTVPIDDYNFTLDHTLEDLIEMAKGEYGSGHAREGLIFRTMEEMYCERLKGRASFKVINNDFLLKVKE